MATTQSLHNKCLNFTIEVKKKLFLPLFFLFSFSVIYAQDSIPSTVSLDEKKNLKFQEFFFKALTEKSKKNYQLAIESLEECNLLIPNNKAVFFELSKNYFLLNKTFEASEYANKILVNDPDNLWVLEYLVKIYRKGRNFQEAITVQQNIIKKHPKEKQQLVYLYLQNNQTSKAFETLKELESEKLLNRRLRNIYNNLIASKNRKSTTTKVSNSKPNEGLETIFQKDKSFINLKNLLNELASNKSKDLLKYSDIGISLYPAQPLVYLMNGKAKNNTRNFSKALESLQNGIDFVIDDKKMEQQFYIEFSKAYKGLGKIKEAEKYKNKASKIK